MRRSFKLNVDVLPLFAEPRLKTLIVGAGPVGLAAALALKLRGVSDDITVLEAGARDAVFFGDRNIALSAASWRFLTKLGVTVGASDRAQIRTVEITQRGAFGLLRLDARDVSASELGAASPYPALKTALDNATHAAGIQILYDAKVASVQHVAAHAELHLATGEQMRADCVVLADGAGSDLVAEFKRIERDSGQIAVITRVSDKDWTVIWARPRADAERMLQLDANSLSDEINAAFGNTMGALTVTAKLTSYPLVWRVVEPRASGAIVALGNAAQGLHPVAAQGLNLGLTDSQQFADSMSKRTGSLATTLTAFARKRGVDRFIRIGFTSLLAYGFDRGGWLLDVPRGLGLTAVQMLPPLRREITRRLAL